MASKAALLPYINRNLCQIMDHNGYGLFAYGSRGCIYVLDLKTPVPSIIDSKVIRNGHRGKVLSLSLCKSGSRQLLASVGEEMILKIWDLETATCIASTEIKECSHVVEWLHNTSNLVVFSEANGCVAKWNFETKNLVRIKTCSDKVITVFSSSQKCPELLAVGHAVGTISILNVKNHTYVRSLKAHSMEIHSLSWSLVSPSTLLSSSIDQSARIWRIDEDKPIHTYYYPSSRFKDKFEDKKGSRICSVFHPENPDVIICSNVRGTVGSVQFQENAAPKFTPYFTDDVDHHFKSIFQMLLYVDFTEENKNVLLTCDPVKIAVWSILDQKILSLCYFIQGNIFDLAVSSINHSLLAVGAGDGFLKVLNMQSQDKLMVTSVYINLRMKIMSIAWHPSAENIIAYGSDEGRVGIVDFSKRRNLYSFETHHSNTVYCLQWGPCSKIKDSKQAYFLYSCGGGCIMIHELSKPKEKAVSFETIASLPAGLVIDHKSYSELCWKSDYSCLAIGTYHGSVYMYNDKLDFLFQLSLQLKHLENLRWHPIHTYSSYSKESKYSSWLAAVGNDENIHIFDAAEVLSGSQRADKCKLSKTLVGHKKRVSTVCWSSHTDGHLISGSRDGVVQVWNAITGTPIANYMCHKDQVYAVQWSVLDPDIVYSGGMDNCLRMWHISEQNQHEIPTKLVARQKAYRAKRKPSPDEKAPPDSSVNEVSESRAFQNNTDTSAVCEAHLLPESVQPKMKQLKSKADFIKEKAAKSGLISFNTCSKEESFQNVLKLVDILCSESVSNDNTSQQMTSEDLLNIGLFADQFTALKMLEAKSKIEKSCGNSERAAYLQIMSCNVSELLLEAAEKKELTEFLVSISPTVSPKFWLEMCEKYAVQLIEEQQIVKGSIYFLLCGKLYDALRILLERGKLLDALAVAKARLPESDSFFKIVLHKVASQYSYKKQFENEAACYIALKDPLHAAKIMYCAGDSKYGYASVYICSKFNLTESAHEYAVMCVEKCLSQNDWPTFYKIAELVEAVKVYSVVIRVHEIISSHIKALKKEDGIIGNNIFGVTGSKILLWSGKVVENASISFLAHIYEVLKSEGLLPDDKSALGDIHQALNSLATRKSEASTEAHVSVAIYVTQVIVTSLLGNLLLATQYFMKIFRHTHNVVFMPKVICWIFFPLDVYWCSNKNTFLCDMKKVDREMLPSSSHFQNIFNAVCDKFRCIGDSETQVLDISPDMISNSDVTVRQVLTSLSRKTIADSLLLYFTTHYLSELRRLAKKGWRFRCYDNGSISNVTPEGMTCMFDSENGRFLINSQTAGGLKSLSKEDVLKLGTQSRFWEHVPSITDVISHMFSSEMDSNTKDELLQKYGFKDVPEFLQRVMHNSPENEHSSAELSSVGNMNGQVGECKVNSEDEDLHAQCWTDVSLYYILTKSFFSVICRNEYALLYYLKKYRLSLDKQIADLARLESGASKVNLGPNEKENGKDVDKSSNENIISSSLTDDINMVNKMDTIAENKSDSASEATKLENQVNVIENISNGILLELECKQEYALDVVDRNKPDSLLNGNTNLGNSNQSDLDLVILNNQSSKEEVNEKDGSLNVKEESPALDRNVSVDSAGTRHCNSDVLGTETKKTNHGSDSIMQDKLQIQREKISEQIQHLLLEDFWYPDPFVSTTDLKGLCCDIFHKHPCVLVKQTFHELAHKVDLWCTQFCPTGKSWFCEICKKTISA